jgi:L-ribulose-5-phosphate 4-epimerase
MQENLLSATKKAASTTEEARLRNQVAACTLLLNDLGILGYSGHVSARLPGDAGFLIQSFDQSRASLHPDALLICDMQGQKLSGPKGERPPAEVFLHSEILRARPDVHAVAHFHYDRATAFTLVEDVPLAPMKNHAIRWASGIPVHDDPSHLNTPERGASLAATLGARHAAQIRAHGQVLVAENIPGLLVDCVHFVENAEAMYAASLLGRLRPLSAAEIAGFEQDLKRDKHISKLWHYYVSRAHAQGLIPESWEL